MGCVYLLRNKINGLVYIGQTSKTFEQRFYEHCRDAKHGSKVLLAGAFRVFGHDAFEHEIFSETEDTDELDRLERKYIAEFNSNATRGGTGYNMTSGGQGTSGFKWSEKSKNKKRKHIECTIELEQFQKDLNELTWGEISIKYNVNGKYLRRWMKELNLTKKRVQRKVHNQNKGFWSKIEEDCLLELYFEGKSPDEIGLLLSRSSTAITVKLLRVKDERGIKHRRFRNGYQKQHWVKTG